MQSCTPTVSNVEAAYSSHYDADGALEGACESLSSGSFWLLPNDMVNVGFTIDIGCTTYIDKIMLRNTHNADAQNR